MSIEKSKKKKVAPFIVILGFLIWLRFFHLKFWGSNVTGELNVTEIGIFYLLIFFGIGLLGMHLKIWKSGGLNFTTFLGFIVFIVVMKGVIFTSWLEPNAKIYFSIEITFLALIAFIICYLVLERTRRDKIRYKFRDAGLGVLDEIDMHLLIDQIDAEEMRPEFHFDEFNKTGKIDKLKLVILIDYETMKRMKKENIDISHLISIARDTLVEKGMPSFHKAKIEIKEK